MNRFLYSTITTAMLTVGCSSTVYSPSSSLGRNDNGTDLIINLYPNITPGKLTFIGADEAKRRNVAHVVIKYKGKMDGICHFGVLNIPVNEKVERLIGTSGHCVTPGSYENSNGTINNRVDYILARSLTRLFPKGSGIEFVTTDNPKPMERSSLYGDQLHGANVEMNGCLPHGIGINTSTCFNFNGKVYMKGGENGKATVYFERKEYIELLRRSGRTCKDAYISGVSGNYLTDNQGKMVGFVSTAVNACEWLHRQNVLNEKGIPIRVNAFPITFEPMRHPGSNGQSRIILN